MKAIYLQRNVSNVTVIVKDGNKPSYRLRNTLAEVSPTFEWGFGGAGPEALAFSIVSEVMGHNHPDHFYSEWLKWDIIARVPAAGAVIHESTIRALLESYKGKTNALHMERIEVQP